MYRQSHHRLNKSYSLTHHLLTLKSIYYMEPPLKIQDTSTMDRLDAQIKMHLTRKYVPLYALLVLRLCQ